MSKWADEGVGLRTGGSAPQFMQVFSAMPQTDPLLNRL